MLTLENLGKGYMRIPYIFLQLLCQFEFFFKLKKKLDV